MLRWLPRLCLKSSINMVRRLAQLCLEFRIIIVRMLFVQVMCRESKKLTNVFTVFVGGITS